MTFHNPTWQDIRENLREWSEVDEDEDGRFWCKDNTDERLRTLDIFFDRQSLEVTTLYFMQVTEESLKFEELTS